MSDIFDEEDDELNETDVFVSADDDLVINEGSTLDARRRLEMVLEEKRLREELRDEFDDFVDF